MSAMFVDIIYNWIAIPVLILIAKLAGLVNSKLRHRNAGIRQQRSSLEALAMDSRPCLLFHSASMGELEQLLPVITAVRRIAPEFRIITSSFSMSGFLHADRLSADVSSGIDMALYLPYDDMSDMNTFIEAIRPTAVVIDRYDIWRNFARACTKAHAPIILINATVPGTATGLLKNWTQSTYKMMTSITAITQRDAEEIGRLLSKSIPWRPDSRIDRILSKIASPSESILKYKNSKVLTIVCGSTWPQDHELLSALADTPNVRLIIVPHEPTAEVVKAVCAQFKATAFSHSNSSTEGHLVVDSVGMLLSIYALADLVYVGGGFGAGVHSVTEPALYGTPLSCGPRIERSRDAVRLHDISLLTIVQTQQELIQWQKRYSAPVDRASYTASIQSFFAAEVGTSEVYATEICAISRQRPHTSNRRSH